jgi:chromosomal replication initiation ATPase DnaA
MTRQLPLDLDATDRWSRDNFVADAALNAVLDIVLKPQGWIAPHLVLLGAEGSGKSHVGHMFATGNDGIFLSAAETFSLEVGALEERPYIIDDAEAASQPVLFHLSNHATRTGQPLLLLTTTQPRAWPIEVPDLASRLYAMRVVTIPEPDESLLRDILMRLFARRAISPSPDAVDYVMLRIDRSVGAVQKTVTELEYYAGGRPFNRALARDYFGRDDELPFAKPGQQDFDVPENSGD